MKLAESKEMKDIVERDAIVECDIYDVDNLPDAHSLFLVDVVKPNGFTIKFSIHHGGNEFITDELNYILKLVDMGFFNSRGNPVINIFG